MGVVPHGAREHNLDFLAARKAGDFIVVRDIWVKADILEVLRDDFGCEFAEAKAFPGSFVVIEFLDKFVETELEEGFTGDLGIVFWEHVDPFSGLELVWTLREVRMVER